jgi:hypothetical protein
MFTLTGAGERSHLLTPDINLDTHVLDVVDEMKWQERRLASAARYHFQPAPVPATQSKGIRPSLAK